MSDTCDNPSPLISLGAPGLRETYEQQVLNTAIMFILNRLTMELMKGSADSMCASVLQQTEKTAIRRQAPHFMSL